MQLILANNKTEFYLLEKKQLPPCLMKCCGDVTLLGWARTTFPHQTITNFFRSLLSNTNSYFPAWTASFLQHTHTHTLRWVCSARPLPCGSLLLILLVQPEWSGHCTEQQENLGRMIKWQALKCESDSSGSIRSGQCPMSHQEAASLYFWPFQGNIRQWKKKIWCFTSDVKGKIKMVLILTVEYFDFKCTSPLNFCIAIPVQFPLFGSL